MIIADWISTRILFNNYQPNTAFTEAQKGFNRPLFETGWLARNVQTKTRHKGVS
jgi:hypothetical protein